MQMNQLKKFSLFQFIVNQDNYALPLPLTFRQSKQIPTIYGGCFSVVHLLVTICWLGFTALELTTPTWNISKWTTTGIIDNNATMNYQPEYMLLPTMQPNWINPPTPDAEIDRYFTIWYSLSNIENSPVNYSRGVLCSSLEGIPQDLTEELAGAYCPSDDMLQNYLLASNRQTPTYSLYIWAGYCSSAVDLFGDDPTECVPYDEQVQNFDNNYLYLRTYTELPNGDFVIEKDQWRSFTSNPMWVNGVNTYMVQLQIMVQPLFTSFATNWFWNTFTTYEKTYYDLSSTYQQLAPNNTANYEWGHKSFFSVIYSVGLSKDVVTWARMDVMEDISNFGGIMGLITLIFTKILAPMINFQQDLELSRTIYTQSQDETQNEDNSKDKNKGISSHLAKREPFQYLMGTICCDTIKSNFCCCCCCLSSCKQSRSSDRFDKARSLLYAESDIVGLIKQNRLSTFLSARYLKPHHHSLMRWFNEYRVKDDSDDEELSQDSDNDVTHEYISRMVDQRQITPRTDRELEIVQRIKDGQAIKKQLSSEEYPLFINWLFQQKTILEWTTLDEHYKPGSDETDLLALARIVGKKVQLNQENELDLSNEFRAMVQENIKQLEAKSNDYPFLKKYNLTTSSSDETLARRKSQFDQRRDASASMADNTVRLLLDEQNYSQNIQDQSTIK